jgi:hypothetical protein
MAPTAAVPGVVLRVTHGIIKIVVRACDDLGGPVRSDRLTSGLALQPGRISAATLVKWTSQYAPTLLC